MNYSSLFQLNTRVKLTSLSGAKHKATLDDIPERELDELQTLGFEWIWLLSVWKTGPEGQKISQENQGWLHEFEATLPDLSIADIGGSGFAIVAYEVSDAMGGKASLLRLRNRLRKRNIKLMLDFVPNHVGPDHPWIKVHPEYFIHGTAEQLADQPQNFRSTRTDHGTRILAFGRDPYFDGWPDTFQLDYSNPDVVRTMTTELNRIAEICDGVRCDMAMLILPEIFERTWGRRAASFWPEAIQSVKLKHPGFCFMAEVYWNMEWEMQQIGFDWTYDKRLYDRLREGDPRPVREHLNATLEYQQRSVRFLENHDEARAASVFDTAKHKCAAAITYSVPGLRFVHEGQIQGRLKKISPHLIRGPVEPINRELENFYLTLLRQINKPVMKKGSWLWLEGRPAWQGNESWNSFIAHLWTHESELLLVIVNYAPHPSQCYLPIPIPVLATKTWLLRDLFTSVEYQRNGDELCGKGLYLAMESWQFHMFELVTP